MSDLLWTVGAIAVCVGLYFVASRMEPHWVSKDGQRFVTSAEPTDRYGLSSGRRREVRVTFLPDGGLGVARRSLQRSTSSVWRILGKSPKPPKGKEVYLLRPIPDDETGQQLALRIPKGSRIVPRLDELVPGQRSET